MYCMLSTMDFHMAMAVRAVSKDTQETLMSQLSPRRRAEVIQWWHVEGDKKKSWRLRKRLGINGQREEKKSRSMGSCRR